MAFQIDIRKIGPAIKQDLRNIVKILNPYTFSEFFKNMKENSRRHMLIYMLILGTFTFIGYFLNLWKLVGLSGFWLAIRETLWGSEPACDIVSSFKSALLYYLTFIFTPFFAGHTFHFFSRGLIGRDVSREEGVTLFAYISTPLLISGIFRIISETRILHLISAGISVYMLYAAINSRYGFERSFLAFGFMMIIVFILSMLIFGILSAILSIPEMCY
ncbi:MAG: hypothetical protein DRO94_00025 [Candidatus Altiarchaeales archaeon]|nr:MAG: hypothetical protein DRO95_03500 [Candidatus Altiarchaeales archaeon]RLI95602.1 MAG: hypothetical protein DRO94_00025 [Candidatus Altiarchaeales archaeon]HDO82742.1 hypothetical protein [Candidatus Altiarchaeales archaeon]HEX55391.1 hypothetical protein [Candidatus Altiarchaeales archaeon]